MGCGRKVAVGQWYGFCGDRDMGCAPALCEKCGGDLRLPKTPEDFKALAEREEQIKKIPRTVIRVDGKPVDEKPADANKVIKYRGSTVRLK